MKSLILFALAVTAAASAQTASDGRDARPGFGEPRAPARSRPCLSQAEARGLATFVLPGLIDGVAQRCRGTLGRDAFLRAPAADALSARLRTDAAPSWPLARTAIEKLNGAHVPTLFGERFVRNAAEGIAADLVLRDFDKNDCGAVDGLVANLAPLPSANMSGAVSALIALGADKAGDDAPLRICAPVPAPAR